MAENGDCGAAAHKPQKRRKEVTTKWRCDFCKIATFSTFEEASRHEEQCRGADENNELFCDVCKVERFRTAEEKQRHETHCRRSQELALKRLQQAKKKNTKQSAESKKPVHGFFSNSKRTAATAKSIAGSGPRKKPRSAHTVEPSGSSTNGQGPKKKDRMNRKQKVDGLFRPLTIEIKEEIKKPTKKASTNLKTPAKLAAIFGPNKTAESLLAEHRAAEFQAKRRAAADKDRKRKTAKQKQEGELAASKPEVEGEFTPFLPFPKQSHLIGQPFPDASVRDSMVNARTRLTSEEKHVGLCMSLLPTEEPCSIRSEVRTSARISADPLKDVLSSILIRPPGRISTDSQDNRLWVDKYDIASIPEDVCGAANKEIGVMVMDFIEEWKTERHKAHELRAERQEALKRVKKKRKKRTTNFDYGDDDLWDYDEKDGAGLQNVCLISGPVCSGKTSLVRAAARQLGCKVIEINTGESRGGAAIKKMVEEATQSDSTSDMFRNKTNHDGDLCDSDEEGEEGRRARVPVILFDEVDTLDEDDGDGGFWSAVKGVAKNAKCPIFLTANKFPSELLSAGLDFRHFESTKPTPLECIPKMYKVIKQERLLLREGVKDPKAALSLVAELCGCDLRRIVHELQVHAGTECHRTVGKINLDSGSASATMDECTAPCISSISPTKVDPFEPTFLSIQGSNFGSMIGSNIRTVIGGRLCSDFEVVNAETILAVCPPCRLPQSIKSGCDERRLRKCFSSRCASVTVEIVNMGLTKSSAASWTSDTCDGAASAATSNSVVRYEFPPLEPDMIRGFFSDEELTDPDEPKHGAGDTPRLCLASANSAEEGRTRTSREVFQEGIQKWRSENNEEAAGSARSEAGKMLTNELPSNELDGFVAATSEESDIAVFEGRESMPVLAGAVHGHAASLIDESLSGALSLLPDRLTRNTKPPTLERLLQLGWNDTAHYFGSTESLVVRPTCAHERRLWFRAVGAVMNAPPKSGALTTTASTTDDETEEHDELEEFTPTAVTVVHDNLMKLTDPACFDEFGNLIRGLSKRPRGFDEVPAWRQAMIQKRATLQHSEDFEILHTVLSEDARAIGSMEMGECRFARGVVDQHRLPPNAVLDFLPILGHVARSESNAEAAYKALENAGGRKGVSGRRRTRQNTREGRRHYFSGLNNPLIFNKEDAEAAGRKLADRLLV